MWGLHAKFRNLVGAHLQVLGTLPSHLELSRQHMKWSAYLPTDSLIPRTSLESVLE